LKYPYISKDYVEYFFVSSRWSNMNNTMNIYRRTT